MKLDNKSIKTLWLDMNILHSGLYFQAEPNQNRIEQIVSNFDWNKLQPLDVSYRDGRYNVVDGQHRLFATKKKFKKATVPCLVRFNLSECEEMELFVELAKDRRKVKPMEIYKALYGSGNKLIVDMVDSINETELVFDFKDSKGKDRITAIETIHNIFIQLGGDDFRNYLKLIRDTWGGEPISLQQHLLNGMFEFFKSYRFDYNEKTFVKKLSRYSPLDIKREGQSDLVAKGYTGYAKAILNKYNKGLKEKNRLISKW